MNNTKMNMSLPEKLQAIRMMRGSLALELMRSGAAHSARVACRAAGTPHSYMAAYRRHMERRADDIFRWERIYALDQD